MRKITTKKETNEFYKIINDHIDDYINQWKIDPKNLKKYFSNKKKKEQFLSRTGLNDVEKIGVILDDVLEARDAMSRDNILKFESFLLNENLKLESSTVNHEKALADLFKTSLSHIEVKNKEKNHFIVDDLGDKHEVCIFSADDFDKLRSQIKDLLVDEAKQSDLDLYQVKIENSRNLKTKLNLSLSDILDTQKLEDKLIEMLTDNKLIAIISSWLSDPDTLRSGKKFSFLKKYHNYLVWNLVSKSN